MVSPEEEVEVVGEWRMESEAGARTDDEEAGEAVSGGGTRMEWRFKEAQAGRGRKGRGSWGLLSVALARHGDTLVAFVGSAVA